MVPGQVSQHFGVREDWPPLSQPTASAGARDYGCCGGPRLFTDADASSFTSAEFWGEVRTEDAVGVRGCVLTT